MHHHPWKHVGRGWWAAVRACSHGGQISQIPQDPGYLNHPRQLRICKFSPLAIWWQNNLTEQLWCKCHNTLLLPQHLVVATIPCCCHNTLLLPQHLVVATTPCCYHNTLLLPQHLVVATTPCCCFSPCLFFLLAAERVVLLLFSTTWKFI